LIFSKCAVYAALDVTSHVIVLPSLLLILLPDASSIYDNLYPAAGVAVNLYWLPLSVFLTKPGVAMVPILVSLDATDIEGVYVAVSCFLKVIVILTSLVAFPWGMIIKLLPTLRNNNGSDTPSTAALMSSPDLGGIVKSVPLMVTFSIGCSSIRSL